MGTGWKRVEVSAKYTDVHSMAGRNHKFRRKEVGKEEEYGVGRSLWRRD